VLALAAILVAIAGWRWTHRAIPRPPVASAVEIKAALAPLAGAANPAAAPAAGAAVPLAAPVPDPALQQAVEKLVDDDNGTTAIVVRNLRTGASAAYHDRDVYPSASLAKVPILVEVYRRLDAGTLKPDDRVTITGDAITGGAGVLQAREGEQLSVAELLNLAVTVSDNVAARLLLNTVGGVDAVNKTLAGLGLTQTRLYADDRPNTTTAAEMAALLTSLAARPGSTGGQPLVGTAPADNSLASLLALPQAQAWLTQGVPRGVTLAHKSGQLPGVRHDAGIVYGAHGPYVVVGLTNDLGNQDDAEAFLADLAETAYRYFEK
jgi:beta-lactamase class A